MENQVNNLSRHCQRDGRTMGDIMKQDNEFPTEYIELQIAARNIADCSLLVYYATDEAAQQRHKIELAHHIKRIKKILEELECQG